MAGNISVARWISGRLSYDYGMNIRNLTPKSWRFLGEGSSRVAMLDPRNTVWKVELPDYGSANVDEFDQYQMLKHILPDMFILPETSLYRVKDNNILAMEYVEGVHPECSCYDNFWFNMEDAIGCDERFCWKEMCDRFETALRDCGVDDFHPGNVLMTEDERMVLIDFAQ